MAAIKDCKADIVTEAQYHVFLHNLSTALKDKDAFKVPSPLITTSKDVSYPQDNFLFKKYAKANATPSNKNNSDGSVSGSGRRLRLPVDHCSTYTFILSSLREVRALLKYPCSPHPF